MTYEDVHDFYCLQYMLIDAISLGDNILLRLNNFYDYDNKNFKMFIVMKNTKVIILKNKIFCF